MTLTLTYRAILKILKLPLLCRPNTRLGFCSIGYYAVAPAQTPQAIITCIYSGSGNGRSILYKTTDYSVVRVSRLLAWVPLSRCLYECMLAIVLLRTNIVLVSKPKPSEAGEGQQRQRQRRIEDLLGEVHHSGTGANQAQLSPSMQAKNYFQH